MADAAPRLVAVVDDARLAREDFGERLAAFLAAGLPAVWLRGRDLPAGRLEEIARAVRAAASKAGAELWVSPPPDLARLAAADRLHLPERGMPLGDARAALEPGVRVGRSVHGVEAAVAAAGEGHDHLVLGTIHATASHPYVEPGGPERIRAVRSALDAAGLSPTLYTIGGIDPDRAAGARAAGADGVVALRALWDAADPAAAVAAFRAALGAEPPGARRLEG
ncbi:MAG TPA: thiamine phosphate synthase [Gemmatimonadota bacterium]|nr:thiamine phosphate synthase [Gemmatimonadota bacterium]